MLYGQDMNEEAYCNRHGTDQTRSGIRNFKWEAWMYGIWQVLCHGVQYHVSLFGSQSLKVLLHPQLSTTSFEPHPIYKLIVMPQMKMTTKKSNEETAPCIQLNMPVDRSQSVPTEHMEVYDGFHHNEVRFDYFLSLNICSHKIHKVLHVCRDGLVKVDALFCWNQCLCIIAWTFCMTCNQ